MDMYIYITLELFQFCFEFEYAECTLFKNTLLLVFTPNVKIRWMMSF